MYTNNAKHPIALPLRGGKFVRLPSGASTEADVNADNEIVKLWLDAELISSGKAPQRKSVPKPEIVSEENSETPPPGKPYEARHKSFGDWGVVDVEGNWVKAEDDADLLFRNKEGDAENRAKAHARKLNLT